MIKNYEYTDVTLTPGNFKIAKKWWGQMWCKNIETYAKYSNRLERGRTYVRRGTIKKLTILNNKVNSEVSGSEDEPYKISIDFEKINQDKYDNIIKKCKGNIDNLENLCNGTFPEECQYFLSKNEYGLFPSENEIRFKCSCKDFETTNNMCKHVAATLYAIGNKMDDEPLILFLLRGIDINEFSNIVFEHEVSNLFNNYGKISDRTLNNDDIKDLFGIDIVQNPTQKIDISNEIAKIDKQEITKDLLIKEEINDSDQKDNVEIEDNIKNVESIVSNESNIEETKEIDEIPDLTQNQKKSFFHKIKEIFKK